MFRGKPTLEDICSQDSKDVPDVAPIEDIQYGEDIEEDDGCHDNNRD